MKCYTNFLQLPFPLFLGVVSAPALLGSRRLGRIEHGSEYSDIEENSKKQES